jgi:DNA-binding transcriptional ArsR family regulator
LGLLEAARLVLETAGEPLRVAEIARRAVDGGLVHDDGRVAVRMEQHLWNWRGTSRSGIDLLPGGLWALRDQSPAPRPEADQAHAHQLVADSLAVATEHTDLRPHNAAGRLPARQATQERARGPETTPGQLRCLTVVAHLGQPAMSGLAERLGLSPGTVTGLVDALVARGLVKRLRDAEDRRIVRLRLTAEGRRQCGSPSTPTEADTQTFVRPTDATGPTPTPAGEREEPLADRAGGARETPTEPPPVGHARPAADEAGSPAEGRTRIGAFYAAITSLLKATQRDRVHVTVIKRLCREALSLKAGDLELLSSNDAVPRWGRTVEWALNHLKRAGIVEPCPERGFYRLTTTGGRVSAEDAVEMATEVERERHRAFRQTSTEPEVQALAEPACASTPTPVAEREGAPAIEDLGISPRLLHGLQAVGATDVAGLLQLERDQLAAAEWVGVKTLAEFDRLVARVRAQTAEVTEARSAESQRGRPPSDAAEGLPPTPTELPPAANTPLREVSFLWRDYAVRFTNALVLRAKLETIGDVLRMPEEEFASVDGVGAKQVALFSMLQAELWDFVRAHPNGPPDAAKVHDAVEGELAPQEARPAPELPPSANAPLWDIPFIWSEYPLRLTNSLRNRARLETVSDLLQMSPEDFGEVPYVGRVQVQLFRDLRRRLLTLVEAHPDALPGVGSPSPGAAPTDEAGQVPGDETPAALVAEPVRQYDSLRELLLDLPLDKWLPTAGGRHSSRNRAIWLRYYGLDDGERDTLNEVGVEFSLTRERVRQIVAKVSGRLPWRDPRLASLAQGVRHALGRCLGVATCRDFARLLADEMGWSGLPTADEVLGLSELASSAECEFALCRPASRRAKRKSGDIDPDRDLVMCSAHCTALWEAACAQVRDLQAEIEEREHWLDFGHRLGQRLSGTCWAGEPRKTDVIRCCGSKDGGVALPPEYLRAVLSPLDPTPLDGEFILGQWWAVLRHGRTKREIVRAALQLLGRPTHYTELAAFIRKRSVSWADVADHAVHARLMNYPDEFILIETLGTYGLSEWGVERYKTAGDHVEEFLRKRRQPALVKEIVRALRKDGVSENNIRACLGQSRFINHSGGLVGLREWANGLPAPKGDRRPAAKKAPRERRLADLFAGDEDERLIVR